MKIKVFLLSLALFSQVTWAMNGQGDLYTYGMASESCGTFLKAERTKSSDYAYFISWTQGYLSAINLYDVFKKQNVGAGTDILSMMVWIKNYCESNPLDNFTVAVLELTNELK